jgi:hypothetical protein
MYQLGLIVVCINDRSPDQFAHEVRRRPVSARHKMRVPLQRHPATGTVSQAMSDRAHVDPRRQKPRRDKVTQVV